MSYETFEDWFNELEGYTLRSERFYGELSHMEPERIAEWLRAAFEAGQSKKWTHSPTSWQSR